MFIIYITNHGISPVSNKVKERKKNSKSPFLALLPLKKIPRQWKIGEF